ncbi:MAG TPA: Stp1/IreP family PP2C-type Ser/Thr phosphatase [Candidatus Cybelea sp.]|nr:Stp1/IreP family PP2C-type Ser/Thr phosphatase [Candidatus Cybelea sp.]
MECQFDWAARSDVGRVRANNEDAFRVAPELDLFVLSDGMGGLASGEVASRMATEAIVAHCRAAESDPSLPLCGGRIGGVSPGSNRLASAIRCANREIRHAAERNPAWGGMGATVVAVQFAEERMSVAHVGDSRAYRFRPRELQQLTRDHSFVAEQVRRGLLTETEAGESKLQNVLLRALGAEAEVEIDVEEELMLEGDTVLLCSDGLTRELSDAQIRAVLEHAEDAQRAADQLIDLANAAGGEDNITAVVVRHAPKPVGAFARIGQWIKGSQGTP